MPVVELRFTPLPAHVRTARLVAAALARRAGIEESLVDEVKLAVGEACTRAVVVQREHAGGADVVVTLSDDEGTFAVTVRDGGPPEADTATEATGAPVAEVPDLVDVTELAREPAGDMPPGFGLALIAGLVDDVEVVQNDAGTAVRMAWSLVPAPAQ